jgi:hypothetical protein
MLCFETEIPDFSLIIKTKSVYCVMGSEIYVLFESGLNLQA